MVPRYVSCMATVLALEVRQPPVSPRLMCLPSVQAFYQLVGLLHKKGRRQLLTSRIEPAWGELPAAGDTPHVTLGRLPEPDAVQLLMSKGCTQLPESQARKIADVICEGNALLLQLLGSLLADGSCTAEVNSEGIPACSCLRVGVDGM